MTTLADLIETAWQDFARRTEGNHGRALMKSDFEDVVGALLRKASQARVVVVSSNKPGGEFRRVGDLEYRIVENPKSDLPPCTHTTQTGLTGVSVAKPDLEPKHIPSPNQGLPGPEPEFVREAGWTYEWTNRFNEKMKNGWIWCGPEWLGQRLVRKPTAEIGDTRNKEVVAKIEAITSAVDVGKPMDMAAAGYRELPRNIFDLSVEEMVAELNKLAKSTPAPKPQGSPDAFVPRSLTQDGLYGSQQTQFVNLKDYF